MNNFTASELMTASGGQWKSNPSPKSSFNSVFTDTRVPILGGLFLALCGENFDGHDYVSAAVDGGAGAVCISASRAEVLDAVPGIPALLVDDSLRAYQEIAGYHRQRLSETTIIGLTGSSGKTSSKEILRTVLAGTFGEAAVYATEANTNNHIGVPQNLLRVTPEHRCAIIEMGTNHPGEIKLLSRIAKPDIALISSIGKAHLEFLHDLKGVAKEKSAIFSALRSGGIAVIPDDCPNREILIKAAENFKTRSFGRTASADIRLCYRGGGLCGSRFSLLETRDDEEEEAEVEWGIPGEHQALNAAAAAAVARSLGIPLPEIAKSLSACKLPGMRSRIRKKGGITWINDAYNANPDSMRAGLSWLAEAIDKENPEQLIICLGDMLELGEHAPQAHLELLQQAKKLFPEASIFAIGPVMTQALANFANLHTVHSAADSSEIIPAIREKLRPDTFIYLKASRGMALEKIEEALAIVK